MFMTQSLNIVGWNRDEFVPNSYLHSKWSNLWFGIFSYSLTVGTLFHIFAMSAIKWHVRFVDCSLIYTNFQRLFVFKTFEFGANFGPRWFSLGFEFETIYGKICKDMNNPTKN